MSQADVLALFNCLVIEDDTTKGKLYTKLAKNGVVLDFKPDHTQKDAIKQVYPPLPLRTFFSYEERTEGDLVQLLVKQLLHYYEVYGLNQPGAFTVLSDEGKKIISMRHIMGITKSELGDKVRTLLYSNAPIDDLAPLKRIIQAFDIKYNINSIQNNEARVLLWDEYQNAFESGDDVVRYICYLATENTMLIKSPDVLEKVRATYYPPVLFEKHIYPLSQVFNRHKKVIMSAKRDDNKTFINRISRLSKMTHVPVRESIAKTFIHKAFKREVGADVLDKIHLRDKFKYLNLLSYKKCKHSHNIYRIRNGKVWHKPVDKHYPLPEIERIEGWVLESIKKDLSHLEGKVVLLDPVVDYGLPTSRKQVLGNLPVGTTITIDKGKVAVGVHWKNEDGARDLDLSAIDYTNGNRIGWGTWAGFEGSDVIFSGDVTDAPGKGAMEFLVTKKGQHAVAINIFSGEIGAAASLVVGKHKKDAWSWIHDVRVTEKCTLESKNSMFGYMKGSTFVVYPARLSGRAVSTYDATMQMCSVEFWTVGKLLKALDFDFMLASHDDIEYSTNFDYDLKYSVFSYDKLEDLMRI